MVVVINAQSTVFIASSLQARTNLSHNYEESHILTDAFVGLCTLLRVAHLAGDGL